MRFADVQRSNGRIKTGGELDCLLRRVPRNRRVNDGTEYVPSPYEVEGLIAGIGARLSLEVESDGHGFARRHQEFDLYAVLVVTAPYSLIRQHAGNSCAGDASGC
jgi:hypothetical protein